MSWKLQVVCTDCGFIGAAGIIAPDKVPDLQVTEHCPRCAKERAPRVGGPGRVQTWRATRKFRRQLRAADKAGWDKLG